MDKLAAIRYVLASDRSIFEYYCGRMLEEADVDFDDFDVVLDSAGDEGFDDMADKILVEGLEAGIIAFNPEHESPDEEYEAT
ncbi:MAG: hypothetical protein HQK57_16600 [Deltaproteobacteria bacterium]|nr:hypothetical protein [Deltaproteobacteria bacterium]MBF0526344.1 hypothetical protein [Deltaproteobacteria bacterium]